MFNLFILTVDINGKEEIPISEITINCIGDSHAEVFKYIEKEGMLPEAELKVNIVQGATAQGMVNPNSRTNALQIFREAVSSVSSEEYLLFMLGEVDCGFVIWYRSEKKDIPVDTQLEKSLQNYFTFIEDTMKRGYMNIIMCTSHLPTIKDGQSFGEIANLRKEVEASQKERTLLTQKYNDSIRTFCRKNGLHLLDIEKQTLNEKENLIKERYLNDNPADHHLETGRIAPLYVEKLKEALELK
ncbi:SGNH/GDSL hydrolase family protein [Bacillus salacetis]|uniref:SGNH/GDSL hydrolase family protein n=1 Tax=Bacillus salacetis TaxID=2315464 RepID=A0A3A1R7K4_9BACI|nr:SGNH/GDSL hydrolase family protein [Bacillus salacetis]RIW37313.1 SGNH/GDSL hydrolase family protein [Bacillus salacetis]